ncbi:MAG: alpha/beta hydrolase, partial [Brevundimonas sp.]|nr:alpha/beta hydrolase [Brevundimonas sp.]
MTDTRTYAERRFTSEDGLDLYARDYAGADGQARLPVIAIHGLTR